MKDLIFVTTTRASRGISSSIGLYSLEDIIPFMKSQNYGTIRYGVSGGYASNLTSMNVREFEQYFLSVGFTKDQITKYFNKEISLKYGIHGDQKANELKGADVKPGYVYKSPNGCKCIYIGKGKASTTMKVYRYGGNSKLKTEEVEGHLYISEYEAANLTDEDGVYTHGYGTRPYSSVDCTKSKRKFVKQVTNTPVVFSKRYHRQTPDGEAIEIKLD